MTLYCNLLFNLIMKKMDTKLVKFEIKEFPKLYIVGKEITDDMAKPNPIPDFWTKCINENIFKDIEQEYNEKLYDSSYVGYMFMTNETEFIYVCGMLLKDPVLSPEQYISYEIDAFTGAIGWIQGKEPDIYIKEHSLTEKAAEEAGYVYDIEKNFSIEAYVDPRYTTPDENGNRIIDYYIPVKKK